MYLGRLGLLGGMNSQPIASSFTASPVWLESNREKQLHGVVTVAPGKQVRVPYVIQSGWRCLSYHPHIVQEAPNASCHVEPLQANFSYSRSDLEGTNHHHAFNQGISGPNVSIPTFSAEADLSMGRHGQQAQGAQQYTTNSAHTTHDVLVLVASVPSEFKKKSWRGYKTKPITTSLKVQLEVILERTGADATMLTPPSSPAPSASAIPSPRVSTAPPAPARPSVPSTPAAPSPAPPPASGAIPAPSFPTQSAPDVTVHYSSSEIAALLEKKLENPDLPLSDSESIGILTHCVQLGEANAAKIQGKDAVIVLGNTGAGKSAFVNYLLGCDLMNKSPVSWG